jgi:hypothetical protein
MEPAVCRLEISIVLTAGEPVVMIWSIFEGRMVILALKPLAELCLDE